MWNIYILAIYIYVAIMWNNARFHCCSVLTGLGWAAILEPDSLPTLRSKERNCVKEEQFQTIIRNSLTKFVRISEGWLSFTHKNDSLSWCTIPSSLYYPEITDCLKHTNKRTWICFYIRQYLSQSSLCSQGLTVKSNLPQCIYFLFYFQNFKLWKGTNQTC